MKQIAVILPIAAGILFGAAGVFVRTLSGFGMSNATVLFARVSFATLLMLAFLLVYNRNLLKIKIKDLPVFIGTGILGMMLLNLCYNNAIKDLSLSLAAVLLSTAPIFVIFMAAILFKEKVTGKKIGCMALAIAGCVLASGLLESGNGINISAAGIGFGVASAVFYALYSIFSRIATDRGYHTYTVIFYSVALITIALLPFADLKIMGEFVSVAPAANLLYLCLHSLCTSILPYIFITLALLYVEAGMVSILASGGEPAAAVVFGIIFYAEIPTLLILIGLVMTIAALGILCKSND